MDEKELTWLRKNYQQYFDYWSKSVQLNVRKVHSWSNIYKLSNDSNQIVPLLKSFSGAVYSQNMIAVIC